MHTHLHARMRTHLHKHTLIAHNRHTDTYFVGKYLVEYALYNHEQFPEGWTDFDALVLPWTFNYTHPVFSRNGGRLQAYPGAASLR